MPELCPIPELFDTRIIRISEVATGIRFIRVPEVSAGYLISSGTRLFRVTEKSRPDGYPIRPEHRVSEFIGYPPIPSYSPLV